MTIDMTQQIDTAPVQAELPAEGTHLSARINNLQAGLRSLARAIARIESNSGNQATQRDVIAMLKQNVHNAMETGGDFAAASRAYQAGNNKLDKFIDALDKDTDYAIAGINALRYELSTLRDLLTQEDA